MTSGSFRFDRFLLDPADRRLKRDDAPVDLNSRYLDALALLVREQGNLVSKDRFLDEVWRGVPVTDEALTQCIKTLRRQLGDDAGRPRFIETVPKHGYRFIAPVERVAEAPGRAAAAAPPSAALRHVLLTGGGGTIGGGLAGLVGGLFYGFASATDAAAMGTASVLMVLTILCLLVALIGAAGVAFGIAGADLAAGRIGPWRILGGAVGGLIVGAIVKLLGLDAFNLLFGRAPGDITGAAEGALIGGAVGLGAWLAFRGAEPSRRRGVAIGALTGGAAGLAITGLGGRLMAGSLDLLARSFPDSRLHYDPVGGLVGESGFGPISQVVTGTLEGALFGGCVIGAMLVAQRPKFGDSAHFSTASAPE